ncbi:MAG: hypothetical protein ACE5L6_07615 [Candidatus Bathyarchaeia archaeon]
MSVKKLTTAITSAMNHLEASMNVGSKVDDVSRLVWRAAADLEYALFLFSIISQDESESSSWKIDLRSKEVEIKSVSRSAMERLQRAQSKIKDGKLREAHKETWMARGYLLKLQEFFEKRRRKLQKAAEKSS